VYDAPAVAGTSAGTAGAAGVDEVAAGPEAARTTHVTVRHRAETMTVSSRGRSVVLFMYGTPGET
jgi:hypothetical protein